MSAMAKVRGPRLSGKMFRRSEAGGAGAAADAGRPSASPPPSTESLSIGQPGPPPDGQRRTGVVWVHGIGTQKARESLFDWTRPILDVFAEWRRSYDEDHPDAEIGENPVAEASVSDPDNPWIAVDIPAFAGRDRGQWLFTEAYWAGDVRAPTFAAAASYLLGRLPTIISGIATGYGYRETARTERLQRLRKEFREHPNVDELDRANDPWWGITDRLDAFWQWPLTRAILMTISIPISVVILAIYAAIHAIPIEAVRKRVEIAAADTFIVEWFADLAVILDDLSQSAAIRTRLLERVGWLRRYGCDDIVLLAHSGGTIVSYATLLRYPTADLDVAKLITFGEAIKLGWRLERDVGDWRAGNSIRGDLKAGHPNLRWVDVWASYDPAPGGPMAAVDGCPLVAVDKLSVDPVCQGIEVESRPVTNFMSLAEDHGGYWSNDEGFLVPVIRHIDDPRGTGDGSRFFSDTLLRTLRTERRRRRVALLLAWRWTAFAAGLLALAGLAWGGVTDAASTGGWVAATFNYLPGHELVSGTIDGVGKAVSIVLSAIGVSGLVKEATDRGPGILGALVPILAIVAIHGRGVGSWRAHDELERRAIRAEQLGTAGLASARSEALLVIGGLVAIVLLCWVGAQGIALRAADPGTGAEAIVAPYGLIVIAAVAVLAFIGRFTLGPRPRNNAAVARVAAMLGTRRS
jgi:hypothetical protein